MTGQASQPRRRAALALLSTAWIAHGLTLVHTPEPDVNHTVIFELWPPMLRVGIWLSCGVVGLVTGLFGCARSEAAGFAAVSIPPFVRLLAYLWATATWVVTRGGIGLAVSAAYATFWLAMLLLVWWIAKWPEERQLNADKQRGIDV